MASSVENSDKVDLTTCTICFETFKNPKYLPCLHSFCEGCIKTYITTTFVQTKSGINCPLCRMYVQKPDDINVEEWSTKLPTNHILVSLIDMNETKSGERLCMPCSRENETESACSWCINCAESLCKSCERYHRRSKFASSHKLVDIENSKTHDLQLNHADVQCTEHPDKNVEAYCKDHSSVCCMTCVMLKHRKCDSVGSIQDAAEEKKKSEEVESFPDNLNSLKKALETIVQYKAENLQNFDKDIETIKSDVDMLFIKISDHLNKLKSNIMSEISKIEKEVRPEIEDKHNEIKCKISTIENDLALFQTNMKYAPPAQFLQAMDKLMEQRVILGQFVNEEGQRIQEIRVTFDVNEKLMAIVKDVEEFGEVNTKRTRRDGMVQSSVKHVDLSSVIPTLSSEVDTVNVVTFDGNEKLMAIEKDFGIFGKVNMERTSCEDLVGSTDTDINMSTVVPTLSSTVKIGTLVKGIAVLENGQIILSNFHSNKIELRDHQCSSVLSSLSLPGRPCGIKMTNDTEGAVAVQGHGLIIFTIRNNQITKINEIKTNVNYDLMYHQGKYYVGCNQHIAVYDCTHRKVRDISVKHDVGFMAKRDDTSLCYTSVAYRGRELYCITMDGTPVFTYSHDKLQFTIGVTVDHAGFIYVCGYHSKNVHHLSHGGKLQRIIFDNLPSNPYCVCFSKRGDKAVIGCDHKVLLYDLK